jgi:hypothetical protein
MYLHATGSILQQGKNLVFIITTHDLQAFLYCLGTDPCFQSFPVLLVAVSVPAKHSGPGSYRLFGISIKNIRIRIPILIRTKISMQSQTRIGMQILDPDVQLTSECGSQIGKHIPDWDVDPGSGCDVDLGSTLNAVPRPDPESR